MQENYSGLRAPIVLSVLCVLLFVPAIALGNESAQATTTSSSVLETNKALVRRLFEEGFSGGDLDVVEAIFSPDIELFDPNLPPGIEGIKAIVRKNNATFDDWSFEIHELLAVDDKVVARWTGSGIHTRSFMSETPTNARVALNGMSIYQIADGRIVTDWVIPDNLQFLIQLGIIPPLGIIDDSESSTEPRR